MGPESPGKSPEPQVGQYLTSRRGGGRGFRPCSDPCHCPCTLAQPSPRLVVSRVPSIHPPTPLQAVRPALWSRLVLCVLRTPCRPHGPPHLLSTASLPVFFTPCVLLSKDLAGSRGGQAAQTMPAFSKVQGRLWPHRGARRGGLEWTRAVAGIPSPPSPLPRTSALSSTVAPKGPLCPLVPKAQLQLLRPFRVVWGIYFPRQKGTAISRLPRPLSHLAVRNLLVFTHVGSCQRLSISPRTASGSGCP